MKTVIKELFNSELKVYYLAMSVAVVAAFMCTIFLLFKSVATLMMMLSAVLIMVVAVILLFVAIYLDITEGRLNASYYHDTDRY